MSDERSTDIETLFYQSLEKAFEQAKTFGDINLVVGIPFYNEKKTLPDVIRILEKGLAEQKILRDSVIVCVGDPRGTDVLEEIKKFDFHGPHLEFLMLPGAGGRGTSIRAILELANQLEADAAIFAADLARPDESGLQPDWLSRVIEPIKHEYDCVLTTLKKYYSEDLLGSFFFAPLLETFYNYYIKSSITGIYAFAHDLVEELCTEIKLWTETTRGYGIDPWLVTRVIRWNKRICEVELGSKLEDISLDKLNLVFKESAFSMFECIKRDEDYWIKTKSILRTPDIYGVSHYDVPLRTTYSTRDLSLFRYSFYLYKDLYNTAYYDYLYADIEDTDAAPAKDIKSEGRIWANIVYSLLCKYWFAANLCKDDILNALTFAFGGRVAGFIEHVQSLHEELENIKGVDTNSLLQGEVVSIKEQQRKDFLLLREEFIKIWKQKELETAPPIVPAHYLEFIPGIPIVLPKKLEGRGNTAVWTEEMFNRLQNRYNEWFNKFFFQTLQVPENAAPKTIIKFLQDFLAELEKTMDKIFPGNLNTEEGTQQVVNELFKQMAHSKTFSIKDEVFREMLYRFPPINVMIPAGCRTSRELLDKMDVRDAVSLANLVETRKYGDRAAILWVLDNLRPDGMGEVDFKPLVLGEKILDGTVKLGNISDLNKLSSRIVVKPLSKGLGGEYPKLRYCLFITRHIAITDNYSYLWQTYARERKNLGAKIRNSLVGRYETTAFSAHNIFENFHHRALVKRYRNLSARLAEEGHSEKARMLEIMCDGYGLSQILDDGTFLPCSAWSWSSYSYKGGRGIPTPMSSHVEEKWFNHEFLEEIYSELGYDPEEIKRMVTQLIGDGRASENLLDVLLGIRPKDVTVVVQEEHEFPPAKPLVRYSGNPILNPVKEHPWESRYVLNAASFWIKDRVYILYRAYGDDEVSRIGLAVTDGYNVLERLADPVFVPEGRREKKGVEDPRVVMIDGRLYMLYTAYDGVIAQISAASITVDDFLNRKFDRWERKGLAFQDIWDKDAILFPEKINGKYVIYHRIEPSIWVSHLDKLEFPAPKEKHSIILGPRSGRMWDSLKIGAGSQPIKTKYGWLLIYHGVDRQRIYRLGVILVDLNDPERLLYRSPNPILSPETEYEIGKEGESWVPNVVFTCGAVPAKDKEILDAEDEILVYYGAADTHVCLASGKVGDLIPASVRNKIKPF